MSITSPVHLYAAIYTVQILYIECKHLFLSCDRYDPASNELISDELGVAYPIVNGIPNLVPSDGRILGEKKKTSEEPSSKS
jgi:uncharacterized protein YbaR (Trm112 family)